MKIITCIFKYLWVWAVVLTSSSIHGMQSPHLQLALLAQEYNQNQLISYLPDEICIHIFSYCDIQEIKEEQTFTMFMKQCVALKLSCKRFNTLLTTMIIGELYKRYSIGSKNKALEEITGTISPISYKAKRPGVLILLYSGADANVGMHMKYSKTIEVQYSNFSLLHKALLKKDTELIKLLLECNADPNQINPNKGPLFFNAPTVYIADLFFKKGAELNAKDKQGNNVLWYVHRLPLELIQFYIEHKVDTRYINSSDKTCILHALASPSVRYINNSNDFFKKGVLLIKTIPDMVNTLDERDRTPTDLMEKKIEMEFYNNNPCYKQPFRRLIAFCRAYGGKTGQELTQTK